MKFASYVVGGQEAWGLVNQSRVSDLRDSTNPLSRTLGDAMRAGILGELVASGSSAPTYALNDVLLQAPLPDAGKIICVGLNYADHIAEMNRPTPEYPVIFTRFNDSLVGHGAALVAPSNSLQFDYEGELALVIGKTGHHIPENDALSYVFGYSVFNDGSIRDYQRHSHQFAPGKNFPKSGSFGPYIVTTDEVGPINNRRIQTKVNDVLVQNSTLDQLVFDVPKLISYCSEWTVLNPGDVIVTGTPGGVGDSQVPKLWLFPGDVVEVEVEGVGRLVNQVIEETN